MPRHHHVAGHAPMATIGSPLPHELARPATVAGAVDVQQALAALGPMRTPGLVAVLGFVPGPAADDTSTTDYGRGDTEARRIGNAFAVHLGAMLPGSVVVQQPDLAYAVVPVRHVGDATRHLERVCRQFVHRVDRADRMCIGIGTVAETPEELGRSRAEADRALRVLWSRRAAGTVAVAEDVATDALLLDLRDLVAITGRRPSPVLARLLAYDRRKSRAWMVPTLQAWLDANGDIPTAAARMYVHANTLHYRLKRIGDVGQVDLKNADSRFMLALEIRVFGSP